MRLLLVVPLLLLAYGETGISKPRIAPVGLPPSLAAKFQQMGCAVPEHSDNSVVLPAIRGKFSERRRTDWAVLCQRGRSTTLVVFETGPDAGGWELWETFAGDGVHLIGRRIVPVDKRYILEHRQPTDGLLPPIDHQGILDGVNGSIVHPKNGS